MRIAWFLTFILVYSLVDTNKDIVLNRLKLPGSRVCNIHFADEMSSPATVICAHQDGVIDFVNRSDSADWRVSSRFRGVELLDQGAPIVTAWNEPRAELWVAGEPSSIALWSGDQQRLVRHIKLDGHDHHVTSLTTEGAKGNIALSGFANGEVALFDAREAGAESCVKRWQCDSGKVVGVAMISSSGLSELTSLR